MADIIRIARTRKHNDRDDREGRMLFYVVQKVETVFGKHLQVRNDVRRKLILLPIIVFAIALDIRNGLISICQGVDAVLKSQFVESSFQKEPIVRVVIDNEESKFLSFHGWC